MNNMNNIGLVAVGCAGLLWYTYASGIVPILYVALGCIAVLGYMAFANFSAPKRRAPTSDKYLGPDDPVSPYR